MYPNSKSKRAWSLPLCSSTKQTWTQMHGYILMQMYRAKFSCREQCQIFNMVYFCDRIKRSRRLYIAMMWWLILVKKKLNVMQFKEQLSSNDKTTELTKMKWTWTLKVLQLTRNDTIMLQLGRDKLNIFRKPREVSHTASPFPRS